MRENAAVRPSSRSYMCYKGEHPTYVISFGGGWLRAVWLALSGGFSYGVRSSALSLVCQVTIVFVERARAFYECA